VLGLLQLDVGGEYRTLANQQLIANQDSKGGWFIANQDKSVLSYVLKADIRGTAGTSTTGSILSFAHEVAKVLLPVTTAEPGSKCTDVSATCRSYPETTCARATVPTGTGNEDCARSQVTTVGRNGDCCMENCFVFRHDKGLGDLCARTPVTRPTPITPSTPDGTLAP
jgi:hypothetical protein